MFTKYPGKLFLMGEFAIMNPGSLSVVSAVDYVLNVKAEVADDYEVISSHGKLKGTEVFTKKIMPHVQSSIKVLNELIELKPFKLTIESQLEVQGVKVGFGSSGVVIVAVLDTLLKYHDVSLTKLQLFKLACLVQIEMAELSSGGDLAACIYKDTIVYQSYDSHWLLDQELDVRTLIDSEWPLLRIEPLAIDDVFDLYIGWTGVPNVTKVSTQSVLQKSLECPSEYQQWVDDSNEITERFIKAVKEKNIIYLALAVSQYRDHMLKLQEWADITIETPQLQALIEATQFPAKVSGSGGGDCGIVLVPKGETPDFLESWENHNIQYLPGGTYNEY